MEIFVVWIDWGTFPAEVRSWTQVGGQKVLFQAPDDVGGVGLSDTTIAFIDVTGPQTQIGIYNTASVDWLPIISDPAAVQITAGPDISGTIQGLIPIDTAGDFVALGYRPPNSMPDQWANSSHAESTAKKWHILPPSGSYLTLMGMSATELLVAEANTDPKPIDGQYFHSVEALRLEPPR